MTKTSVYLDTNVIITIMEAPPSDEAGLQDFWKAPSTKTRISFHASELALAELLVVPYRNGDRSLVEDYLRLFSDRQALAVHAATRAILDVAAVIRSRRKMKLPDAIHLATACVTNCSHLITFDAGIANLDAELHPFLDDIQLAPVKIVRPSPAVLSELSKALS